MNKSVRHLMMVLVVAALALFMCTGCNSDVEDGSTQSNGTISYATENTDSDDEDSRSASGTKSSGKYSPVESARRKEDGFYEKAADSEEKVDVRRYSLETYADMFVRVDDYVELMNHTTSMLQSLRQGDDAPYLFEMEHRLEEMSLELEDEIKIDGSLTDKPRKKLENARMKMSSAAERAWSKVNGGTSTENTSKETTSSIATTTTTTKTSGSGKKTIRTNPTDADESDNSMLDHKEIIGLSLILVCMLLIYPVVRIYQKRKKNNEPDYPKKPARSRTRHIPIKDAEPQNDRNYDIFESNATMSHEDRTKRDEADDTARKKRHPVQDVVPQDSVDEKGESAEEPIEETLEETLEKTLGAACTIQSFIRQCNEIARSDADSDTKLSMVIKLIDECDGKASYVSCLNENDVFYSSSIHPVFTDSVTVRKLIRFDTYLIPSPTIQFDSDKRSLNTFASIEKTGFITTIEPGILRKTGNDQYELIQQGKWTI